MAVTVYQNDILIGVVYCKQRKILGLPTGMLYGDATLSAMVLSAPEDRACVFRSAMIALLQRRGFRAIRLLVPPEGAEREALEEIRALIPVDMSYAAGENHCSLDVGLSYDSFLERMGQRTRRNLRYYRRRFEQSGHTYVPEMSSAEFMTAVEALLKKSVIGANPNGVARAMQIISSVDRPFFSGLRHRDGSWLSVIGGWYEKDHLMIFFQMNDDQDHASSSLSLVMRGYAIEDLIRRGIQTMVFWAGVGDPLRRYCTPVPALKAYVDDRSLLWSASRALLTSATRFFPRRMRWAADWIGGSHECLLKS